MMSGGPVRAGDVATARDRDESSIAASLFEAIVDDLPEQVMVLDRNGAPLFANKALRAQRGQKVPRSEEEWRSAYDVYSSDGSRRLDYEEWPLARALRGERVDNMELRSRDAKGRDAIMLVSGYPRRDSAGALDGAIIMARNITALRRTEEELRHIQKLETIGQLTGGVAHDFNNILAAIMSGVDVIKRGVKADPRLTLAAETIDKAAQRGADLTGQLLAFARKQALRPASVNVDDLVRETLLLLRPGLGAAIAVEVKSVGPVFALADPAQLTTALLNLCINARDAMAERGGHLRIRIDETQANAGDTFARIAVSDDGCGMSAQTAERAVEPFFTTKDVGKGSGLGLSMVFGFVRQSGGDLTIESAEGRGTTVTMLLPRASPQQAQDAPQEAHPPLARMFRVLVVDDDPLVRDALGLQLADEGYIVEVARDGVDAIALAEAGLAFDILLTDIVMPNGVSGLALAEQVRARWPHVRTILSTGYADAELSPDGNGCLLLRKPYSAKDLRHAIALLLQSDE